MLFAIEGQLSVYTNRLKKAASTLGHNEVSIVGKDGSLNLSVVDSNNVTSNAFSIDIDGEFKEDAVFNFILNINNITFFKSFFNHCFIHFVQILNSQCLFLLLQLLMRHA